MARFLTKGVYRSQIRETAESLGLGIIWLSSHPGGDWGYSFAVVPLTERFEKPPFVNRRGVTVDKELCAHGQRAFCDLLMHNHPLTKLRVSQSTVYEDTRKVTGH